MVAIALVWLPNLLYRIPILALLTSASVVLETTVICSITAHILVWIWDCLFLRNRYTVELKYRKFEHFGRTPVRHAEVGNLRINIIGARIYCSCTLVSDYVDPVECLGVLSIKQSFWQTSGKVDFVGFLPIKLHFQLFSKLHRQFPRPEVLGPAPITHYETRWF